MADKKVKYKIFVNGEEVQEGTLDEPLEDLDVSELIDDECEDDWELERAFLHGMICAYERTLGISDEGE